MTVFTAQASGFACTRRICVRRLPSIPPAYESDGGPGVRKIVDLLREHSSHPEDDVQSFLDAIALNWLIAGTDGHAKNYALLLGAQGAVRLAPFYDLASVLPYQMIKLNKAKLAMKIGGEYRLRNITLRHWIR